MNELLALAIAEALQHAQSQEQVESELEPRPHEELMVEFAQNPNALVYVRIGTIEGVEYYMYVTDPKWQDDKVYFVSDEHDEETAIALSKEIYAEFKEKAQEYNERILSAQSQIKDAYVAAMEELQSQLITGTEVDINL